jgi:VCBS repeat-containing protein
MWFEVKRSREGVDRLTYNYRRTLLPAVAALAAACGGGGLVLPGEGAAAKIVIVQGDGQGAPVGAVLPQALMVRVTDSNNRPVQGQTVRFSVTAGGGTVAPASAVTTADGSASARWTLGPTAGPQRLTAAATGSGAAASVSVVFSATAGVASTSISVTSSKNPSSTGEAVQFSATVVWPAGTGTPTGTVTFRDGASSFATTPLPANGTASASTTFTTAGQHTVTAQYSGDANFGGGTSSALTQQVNTADRPPVAANDAYAVNEDAVLTVAAPGVLGNDSDPDGNPITAVKVSSPAHGTVVLNANGSFTYTPTANYSGADAFTYEANDGTLNSTPATVTITVNFVNDPPSFSLAGPNINVSAAAGAQTVPSWAANISPGPGANEASQTVAFQVTVALADQAAFTAQPAIDALGTLTYTPSPLAAGMTPTVTVAAHDNGGTVNGGEDTSAPQTFTITIGP